MSNIYITAVGSIGQRSHGRTKESPQSFQILAMLLHLHESDAQVELATTDAETKAGG